MTLDQKIGQLFMAPACPMHHESHWTDWQKLLNDFHVGNAIIKCSDPISQVEFLNRLQKSAYVPLLIAADAEWGLAMRMPGMIAFPRHQELGDKGDLDAIYKVGCDIGRQVKRVGIHLNLAPVADVNNNPDNIIIGSRSFGADPIRVAECASVYAKGLQSQGVIACGKHFPGHGDTHIDSHHDLPVIFHDREHLEQVEFVPFKRLVEDGIDVIMTAHLYVPAIDPIYPTSLSKACLSILRDDWQFDGLIISDAMNMRAIALHYSAEESALLARKAGTDILLYGDHIEPNIDEIMRETIPRAFAALKSAYLCNELSLIDLDRSVLRILRAKESLIRTSAIENLNEDLHMNYPVDGFLSIHERS